MSLLRASLIAGLSLMFLTGADHREAPFFTIIDTVSKSHEYEVLSWSWEKGEGLKGALPGKENAMHASLAEFNDFRQFNEWHSSQAVLPKASFETAKCGGVLHFILKNVTINSVEQTKSRGTNALAVTMNYETVKIEGDPAIIKACLS